MVCPSDENLRRFLNDADQETSSTDVMSHVLTCFDCQGRISAWNELPRLDAIRRAARSWHIDCSSSNVTPHGPDAVTNVYGKQPLRQIGQYELLRSIGRGGGGEVFEARHVLLRRRVAVKLLTARNSGSQVARQRFFREMESIGQLDDPYIVHAYDAGEVDGTLYLAMELIEGENVESLARRMGPLPIADACEIIRQAALGLQHVHQSGLVHRDLKPSNLLMSNTGVKIADLGLALLNKSELPDDRLTGEHTVLGTADYMAPEQAEGSHAVDIRADIYSLGCTLFRLLAGRAPYAVPENSTPIKKMWAHTSEPIPDLRVHRPEVPDELVRLLEKLMAKNREDRFREPILLADALVPFCRTLDPSFVMNSGEAGIVVPRSATARDPSNPLLTASTSGRLPALSPPGKLSWIAVSAAAGLCVILGLVWWFRQPGVQETLTVPVASVPSSTLPVSPASVTSVVAPHSASHQAEPAALPPLARHWKETFLALPADVTWQGRPPLGTWRLDEDLQALVLHASKSTRLVKLGELDGDHIGNVQLAVTIDVVSDGGSFGFYLGGRQFPADSKTAILFQSIEILWMDKTDSRRRVLVRRSLTSIQAESGVMTTRNNEHEAAILGEHQSSFRLGLSLRDDLLAQVSLDESTFPTLCTEELNSLYKLDDYRGEFGVFAKGSMIEFRNPTYQRAR